MHVSLSALLPMVAAMCGTRYSIARGWVAHAAVWQSAFGILAPALAGLIDFIYLFFLFLKICFY